MSINKNEILHHISKFGTFMLLYGLIYVMQDLIFGRLQILNGNIIEGLPLKFVIFSIVSVFIISKFIKIGSPYKKTRS